MYDALRLPYEKGLTIEPNGNDVVRDDPLFENWAKRRFRNEFPGCRQLRAVTTARACFPAWRVYEYG